MFPNEKPKGKQFRWEGTEGGGMVIRIKYMKKIHFQIKENRNKYTNSVIVYMCNANHSFGSKSNDQVLLKVFYIRDSAHEGTG